MTISDYIQNETSLQARYVKVTAIVDALLDMMTTAATNADIEQYMLDDGQTRLSTTYRSFSDLEKGLNKMMRLQNVLAKQLSGSRILRVMDTNAIRDNSLTFRVTR